MRKSCTFIVRYSTLLSIQSIPFVIISSFFTRSDSSQLNIRIHMMITATRNVPIINISAHAYDSDDIIGATFTN